MKGACFFDTEDVRVTTLDDASVEKPSDAVVQVSLAGLCGSDLHVFHGRETGMDPGTVMGHEFVGTVVAAGDSVGSIKVGQKVYAPFTTNCGRCFYCRRGLTCRCDSGQLFGWRHEGQGLHGGQSEFVRVPLADSTLVPLNEGLTAEQGILLGDNLSTASFSAELADVSPGGVYAVIGCGTVGLLTVFAARAMGAEKIFAIDLVPHRRAAAQELGAIPAAPDGAAELVRDATDGRGADAVMELVGLPAAQQLAYDLVRPGGIMSVIGCHSTEHFAFSPVDAYDKNLTYRTGRCPARFYADKLAPKLLSGEWHPPEVITHRFALDDATEAYDVFAGRTSDCLKAVLDLSAT